MLTDDQIEKAAREYCRLMGMDPDENLSGASLKHPMLAMRAPRWKFVTKQVREHVAMLAAIEAARASAE